MKTKRGRSFHSVLWLNYKSKKGESMKDKYSWIMNKVDRTLAKADVLSEEHEDDHVLRFVIGELNQIIGFNEGLESNE